MEKKKKKKLMKERGEGARLISHSDSSDVIRLQDGSFLKIFNSTMKFICQTLDIDLEKKITSLKPIKEVPEIIIPDTAIYDGRNFIGYVMPAAKGISIRQANDKKELQDWFNLPLLTKEYSSLEKVIKRANEHDIIFPDLLTLDNIFVEKIGDKFSYNMIDSEGIQLGQENYQRCAQISSSLGDDCQYLKEKYMQSVLENGIPEYTGFLKTNLDKRSLLFLYFSSVIGIDLQSVITNNPTIKMQRACFEYYMNIINVPTELKQIAEITLFDDTKDNLYLDSLVDDIAENNDLQVLITEYGPIRKYVRK